MAAGIRSSSQFVLKALSSQNCHPHHLAYSHLDPLLAVFSPAFRITALSRVLPLATTLGFLSSLSPLSLRLHRVLHYRHLSLLLMFTHPLRSAALYVGCFTALLSAPRQQVLCL